MICPYNRKTLTQVTQYTNDLVNEENGFIKSHQEVIREEYAMMDCQQENCGAWHKGKCNYYTAPGETNS